MKKFMGSLQLIVLLVIFSFGLYLMVSIDNFNNAQKVNCDNPKAHILTITYYPCEYSVMFCDENNTLQYDVYQIEGLDDSIECGVRQTFE